jgi:hypothetical protein
MIRIDPYALKDLYQFLLVKALLSLIPSLMIKHNKAQMKSMRVLSGISLLGLGLDTSAV